MKAGAIISASSAVAILADVPDAPLQQRQWVKKQMNQAVAAANAVVDHHVATHTGTLNWELEKQHAGSNPDNHMDELNGVGAHYR